MKKIIPLLIVTVLLFMTASCSCKKDDSSLTAQEIIIDKQEPIITIEEVEYQPGETEEQDTISPDAQDDNPVKGDQVTDTCDEETEEVEKTSQPEIIDEVIENEGEPEVEEIEVYRNLSIEEIMAELGVYPGSEPCSYLESESVDRYPPAVSLIAYSPERTPQYQMVSAQYAASTDFNTLIEWYKTLFSQKGYGAQLRGQSIQTDVSIDYIVYYLPSQPYINVEVHAYMINGIGPLVYELLVVKDILISGPFNDALIPDDVDSITIDYTYYGYDIKVVTDREDILELANRVNSLPVTPGYLRLWYLGYESGIRYTLVFHSRSRGDITVQYIAGPYLAGFDNTGINIEGCPVLEDVHGLLGGKVKQMVEKG